MDAKARAEAYRAHVAPSLAEQLLLCSDLLGLPVKGNAVSGAATKGLLQSVRNRGAGLGPADAVGCVAPRR